MSSSSSRRTPTLPKIPKPALRRPPSLVCGHATLQGFHISLLVIFEDIFDGESMIWPSQLQEISLPPFSSLSPSHSLPPFSLSPSLFLFLSLSFSCEGFVSYFEYNYWNSWTLREMEHCKRRWLWLQVSSKIHKNQEIGTASISQTSSNQPLPKKQKTFSLFSSFIFYLAYCFPSASKYISLLLVTLFNGRFGICDAVVAIAYSQSQHGRPQTHPNTGAINALTHFYLKVFFLNLFPEKFLYSEFIFQRKLFPWRRYQVFLDSECDQFRITNPLEPKP